MSELSDQVKSIFMSIMYTKQAEIVQVDRQSELASLPGFSGMVTYHRNKAMTSITRCYRRQAGTKPYEDPNDAMERTYREATGAIIPVLISALSDGIQMGQEQSFPYKKYLLYGDLGEVFSKDAWRAESDLIAIPFLDDPECKSLFEHLLYQTTYQLGCASGYTAYPKEKLHKIWDLWALATHSLTVGCYNAGYAIGKQWTEENALQGILAATNAQEGE